MRRYLPRLVLAGSLLAVAAWLAASTCCEAGGKATLGRNWSARDRLTVDRIDHAPWDRLLKRYVDSRGNVNYARWKASAGDSQSLDAYIHQLSRAQPDNRAGRQAQLAFWINAYNAVTMKGILREYPTTSIRNHTAKLFGYNIWDDLLLLAGGRTYSLNQMEHEVLRKLGDSRIHFAIVCASKSCPKLRAEAYTADKIEEQLAANARDFFADPSNFQFDANRRQIQLSSILSWFAKDFGATQADQLKTIAPYLPNQAARQLAQSGSARISYLQYDWGLNDQKTAVRAASRR